MTPAGIKQPWRTLMRVYNPISPDPKLDLMLTQPHLAGSAKPIYITAPTLVLAGEKDLIDETQTRRIARSIPGAKLLILPGETHGSYVVHSDKLYPAMANFLRVLTCSNPGAFPLQKRSALFCGKFSKNVNRRPLRDDHRMQGDKKHPRRHGIFSKRGEDAMHAEEVARLVDRFGPDSTATATGSPAGPSRRRICISRPF